MTVAFHHIGWDRETRYGTALVISSDQIFERRINPDGTPITPNIEVNFVQLLAMITVGDFTECELRLRNKQLWLNIRKEDPDTKGRIVSVIYYLDSNSRRMLLRVPCQAS